MKSRIGFVDRIVESITSDANQMVGEANRDRMINELRRDAQGRASGRPDRNRTTLSPERESQFQHWYGRIAKQMGLDPNPDSPDHKYDYRGAYLRGFSPGTDRHWPSMFKDDDHPNRFISPKRDKRVPEGYIWDSKHNTLMREGHFASYYGNLAEDDDNGD